MFQSYTVIRYYIKGQNKLIQEYQHKIPYKSIPWFLGCFMHTEGQMDGQTDELNGCSTGLQTHLETKIHHLNRSKYTEC